MFKCRRAEFLAKKFFVAILSDNRERNSNFNAILSSDVSCGVWNCQWKLPLVIIFRIWSLDFLLSLIDMKAPAKTRFGEWAHSLVLHSRSTRLATFNRGKCFEIRRQFLYSLKVASICCFDLLFDLLFDLFRWKSTRSCSSLEEQNPAEWPPKSTTFRALRSPWSVRAWWTTCSQSTSSYSATRQSPKTRSRSRNYAVWVALHLKIWRPGWWCGKISTSEIQLKNQL